MMNPEERKRKPRPLPAIPETLHREQRLAAPMVSAMTGYGETKLYLEEKAGRFPRAERNGPRFKRWRAGDVLDWLKARAAAQGGQS